MAPQWDSISQLLSDNSKDVFIETSELLIKFASNILKKPNEAKYRKIRLANPIVQSKLLPVSGALECLFEMGFLEDGEFLTMPVGSGLNTLRLIYDDLNNQRKELGAPVLDGATPSSAQSPSVQQQPAVRSSPSPSTASSASTTTSITTTSSTSTSTSSTTTVTSQALQNVPRATTAAQQTLPTQNIHQLESVFMDKVRSSMTHVLMYEDPTLQGKAREVIPLQTLLSKAKDRLRTLSATPPQRGEKALDVQDCLLLELLNWFKTSFFHWVDAPPCNHCGAETRLMGGADPLPEERVWGASRVEKYQCNSCQQFTRFPRYNHPQKLLETRRGRCGEWANCFTLCCRAVGFEARYVLDWTDHVWTEVYSGSQQRWLHCDPCENVCDKPLLYESGWGKKLTYVIAVSKDEVLDVTWRYSVKHKELLTRRRECRESWLCSVLSRLWRQKVNSLPPGRKWELQKRLMVELVEFLTPKRADGQNLSGRTTGSLAWRLARGETGGNAAAGAASGPFTFTLNQEEKERELCHVVFSCAKNKYVRLSSSGSETTGWQHCAHSVKSVFRKEEKDWKMVYLARTEGTQRASISWKFDFTDSGLRIGRCYLRAESAVFENGLVTWTVCADDHCIRLKAPEVCSLRELDVKGCKTLTITADLTGGSGDNSWQHTQLFRQELDSELSPFEVKIHLV